MKFKRLSHIIITASLKFYFQWAALLSNGFFVHHYHRIQTNGYFATYGTLPLWSFAPTGYPAYWANCVSVLPTTYSFMIYSAAVSRKLCYDVDLSYFTSTLVRRIYAKRSQPIFEQRANLSVMLRLYRRVVEALILTEQ